MQTVQTLQAARRAISQCTFVQQASRCKRALTEWPPTSGLPSEWLYCYKSLAKTTSDAELRRRKVSPGVVAFVPGALLRFVVDTVMTDDGRPSPAARLRIGLEFLVSYEQMGVATLRCRRHCACSDQRIDAHQVSAIHNESVFKQHHFIITGAHSACMMELEVASSTSSGLHKFKVRSLTVEQA